VVMARASPSPPYRGDRDLLREWRNAMDSVLASVASVSGGTELRRRMLEPMQRQLELVHEVVERERRVQKQLAGHLFAPVDAVFDLLEESGAMLRAQAEALETAGRALEETARLVTTQAELLERAIGSLRQPAELAKTAAGLERRPPKSGRRKVKRTGDAAADPRRR
jgi:hypothetical protein